MKQKNTILGLVLFLLLFILVCTVFLLSSVPPVDRDALTHHLFIPKLWIKHGGIYEIPEIPFSYYPMNLDLLYTLPLSFGNDIIPKYIHFFFALFSAILLYRYLKKRIDKMYGLLGALFFLSIPIIVKLSITVYVDLGVVFFTTASLLLLLYWAEQHFSWNLLMLAGFCCGLAAGIKYNGLVSIVVLTLLIPLIYQRSASAEQRGNLKAALCTIVFVIATFTTYAPWLIRNTLWTGNPIYPLHNSLIQKIHNAQPTVKPSEDTNIVETLKQVPHSGGSIFLGRKILYGETWWQGLLLPVRIFFEGKDDDPQYFDGKLNPFLLILPALAFLFPPSNLRQRRERNFLLGFTLLYFFFTFFQESLRIRYVVPIVPPLVILALYGLHGLLGWIRQQTTATGRRNILSYMSAIIIPLIMLWHNSHYIIRQFEVIKPLPFVLGNISRDEYITAFRPEYPAIKFTNMVVPQGFNVLAIFLGNRGYYMDVPVKFEQPYTPTSILAQFLGTDENPEHTILDELRQRHISHILLRTDLTIQWLQRLSEQDRRRLAPLFSDVTPPVWNGNGHIVLAVESRNR